MKIHFEEKTYESYFNNELDSKSSIYFPPGQVLESLLGFDASANSKNRELWKSVGFPFWFYPHFSGVKLSDIAKELEIEFKHIIQNIPSIKTNLLFQYKRPEYITTAKGNEWHHWEKEYYRYGIYKEQHNLLEKIDSAFGDKALVLYAAPAVNNLDDLIKFKVKNKIIENSNFKKASDLNNHSKNTYVSSGTYSIACSEPERIENINLISTLESYETNQELENEYFFTTIRNVIIEAMQYSLPFKTLMSEYEDFKEYELLYTFLTMKSFREITGIQWLLSIKA